MKMLASTVQFSSYGRDDSNRDHRLRHNDHPEVAAVARCGADEPRTKLPARRQAA